MALWCQHLRVVEAKAIDLANGLTKLGDSGVLIAFGHEQVKGITGDGTSTDAFDILAVYVGLGR